MRFDYTYRDRANERHDATISAPNKDAAYAALRSQGIKPIRVTLAPGLANRLASFGKRGVAIVVLCVLCLVLGVVVLRVPRSSLTELDSPLRRYPIGDIALIEKGVRTGWADVFAEEGDRFLASFAIPGVAPAVRSTTEGNLREALRSTPTPSTFTSDGLEARQIRAMVAGLKAEARAYLAAGGTVDEYATELVNRQQREISYYEIAKKEIAAVVSSGASHGEVERLWEDRNRRLRKMGIKPIPYPDFSAVQLSSETPLTSEPNF